MIKEKNQKRTFCNEDTYKLIMELYYLNKAAKKRVARLPVNDFRRSVVKRITKNEPPIHLTTFRKALIRIAALW